MGAAENRATVEAAYEAFGRGDIPAVIGINSPDAVWNIHTSANAAFGGEHKGHDGIGAMFQTIGETVDITSFVMQPIAAEGDIVVAYGDQSYTVKKTGKTVSGPLIHLFTFNAAGQLERFEEWESNADEAWA
jgi:ketosteroid isomerase-like protein